MTRKEFFEALRNRNDGVIHNYIVHDLERRDENSKYAKWEEDIFFASEGKNSPTVLDIVCEKGYRAIGTGGGQSTIQNRLLLHALSSANMEKYGEERTAEIVGRLVAAGAVSSPHVTYTLKSIKILGESSVTVMRLAASNERLLDAILESGDEHTREAHLNERAFDGMSVLGWTLKYRPYNAERLVLKGASVGGDELSCAVMHNPNKIPFLLEHFGDVECGAGVGGSVLLDAVRALKQFEEDGDTERFDAGVEAVRLLSKICPNVDDFGGRKGLKFLMYAHPKVVGYIGPTHFPKNIVKECLSLFIPKITEERYEELVLKKLGNSFALCETLEGRYNSVKDGLSNEQKLCIARQIDIDVDEFAREVKRFEKTGVTGEILERCLSESSFDSDKKNPFRIAFGDAMELCGKSREKADSFTNAYVEKYAAVALAETAGRPEHAEVLSIVEKCFTDKVTSGGKYDIGESGEAGDCRRECLRVYIDTAKKCAEALHNGDTKNLPKDVVEKYLERTSPEEENREDLFDDMPVL